MSSSPLVILLVMAFLITSVPAVAYMRWRSAGKAESVVTLRGKPRGDNWRSNWKFFTDQTGQSPMPLS